MYLGVDIGGTSIKFAVVNDDLEIIHYDSCKTPDNVNVKIVDEVYKVAKSIKSNYDFKYLGISSAGVIDTQNMKVLSATDAIKDYIGTDFKLSIGDKLGVDMYVDNDVNCALLGEQLYGCAKGLDEVFCMALGTGIGGSYYLDKTPKGSCFSVGEIGQTLYDKETGKNYEKRASTIALEKKIQSSIDSSLSVKDFFDLCRFSDGKKVGENSFTEANRERLFLNGLTLEEFFNNHRERIDEVFDSWLRDLSEGLVNMILILDPKYVVIGGAISKQGDYLIDKIKEYVYESLPIKINQTKFLVASLDNDAAIYGAISPFVKLGKKAND